jgi:hypothetical protein
MPGQRYCKLCPSGYFQDQSSLSSCKLAVGGVAHGNGSTSVEVCGRGKFMDADASKCVKCAAGQYSDTLGSTACEQVPSGNQVSGNRTFVTPCPVGKFSEDYTCHLCPVGYYQNTSEQTSCRLAVTGVVATAGASAVDVCAAGKYMDVNSSKCIDCDAGRFSAEPGSPYCEPASSGFEISSTKTYQTPCPLGKYKPEVHEAACRACPLGYFQDSLNATVCLTIDRGYHAASKSSGATQQVECPPGTYSTGHALECTSCPLGWSQPKYRSTTCLKCSQGKSTLGNGSRICIGKDCKAEEYLNDTSSEFSKWKCDACPKGAVCDVVADATWPAVISKKGYYRMPGPAPQLFSECLKKDACLGASLPPYGNVSEGCLTSKGYTGTLCHSCMQGFVRSGQHDCLPCDAGSVMKIVVGILAASLVSIYFVWSTLNANEKTLEIEMCKIAMSGVQAVTVLGRYPLSWPSQVSSVLDAVGGAFSVAGDVVSFRCSMDPSDGSRYLRGSAVILASPLIACALAVLFWLVHSRQRNLPLKQVRANMIVTVMVLLFMALPSLNQVTFQLFSCHTVAPGVVRVSGDLELACFGSTHLLYALLLGVPAVCIYVVGIPVAAVLILRRMHLRGKLFKPREESYTASVYQFLYGGYTKETYYWEAVILLRKAMLNVILVTMQASSAMTQALAVQIVLLGSIIAHNTLQPYSNMILNRLELASLGLSYSTLYAGLFLFDEGVSKGVKMVLTISLLGLFCVSIVGFAVSMCIFTSKKRRNQIQEGAHQVNLALNDKVGRLRTSFRRGTRRGSSDVRGDPSEGLEMGVRNPFDEALRSNPMQERDVSVRTKENLGVTI